MGIGAFLKGAVKGVKGAVKKILPKKDDSKGSAADAKAPLMNSAFVFIKPHANTRAVQDLVVAKLTSKRVKILAEGDIAAAKIDKDKLIDQHYYAIASKATLLKPEQLPVPEAKFEAKFGIPWKQALAAGVPRKALDSWFVDPRVRVKGGESGSVFDMLEDLDADECLAAMLTIERE